MKIETVGYHFVHQGTPFEVNRPSGLSDHIVLLMHSPVSISLNEEALCEYSNNTIILLNKKTPRYYRNINGVPLVNDFIRFSFNSAESLERFGLLMDTVYSGIPAHYIHSLTKIIYQIAYEIRERQYHSNEIANLYLEVFFHTLGQCVNGARQFYAEHPLFEIIFPARNRLVNNFQNDPNVNDEAKKSGLSPFYFRRVYKEIFGTTPQSDIIKARLEHACFLLTKTDDTIHLIAEQCGYHSKEHFMRQFKKIMGISPASYRNINR